MKIAFISDCYPSKDNPQYCIFLQQQAKSLIKLGHSVLIIRPCFISYKKKSKFYTFEDIDIVDIYIKTLAIDKLYCDLHNRFELLPFKWTDFDVVSIHLTSTAVFEVIIDECKKLNVPTVAHYHGLNVWNDYYESNSFLHTIYRFINKKRKLKFLDKVNAIVGVSNCVCDEVRKIIKNKNIYTIYNGVDCSYFNSYKKEHSEFFTILCVANLIKIKGHFYLLHAVSNVIKKGYNVKVKLIGDGSEKNFLLKVVKDLDIERYVEFCGVQPYNKVAEAMSKSDMFIMPSYFEAFGCVYVEAMSSGLVTCGCNILGAKEIIDDNIDGLLFPPKDIKSIENSIISIITDNQLREKLEKNAIIKAKNFTWEKSAIALEKVYNKICK